jgi:hypothetical protein
VQLYLKTHIHECVTVFLFIYMRTLIFLFPSVLEYLRLIFRDQPKYRGEYIMRFYMMGCIIGMAQCYYLLDTTILGKLNVETAIRDMYRISTAVMESLHDHSNHRRNIIMSRNIRDDAINPECMVCFQNTSKRTGDPHMISAHPTWRMCETCEFKMEEISRASVRAMCCPLCRAPLDLLRRADRKLTRRMWLEHELQILYYKLFDELIAGLVEYVYFNMHQKRCSKLREMLFSMTDMHKKMLE